MNSMFNPFAGGNGGSGGSGGGNVDLSNYYDKTEVDNIVNKAKYDDTTVKTAIATNITNIENLSNSKQDKLTAGDNITITGNKISAKDTVYDDTAIKASIDKKQDKLTAGNNITISDDNVISATISSGSTYTLSDQKEQSSAKTDIILTNDEGNTSKAITVGITGDGSDSVVFNDITNTSTGTYSTTFGTNNKATEYATLAQGYYSEANAQYAHAEGGYTKAYGTSSHTEGYQTTTVGSYTHAEGYMTTAGGEVDTGFGPIIDKTNSSYVSNSYAHSEGYQTAAIGKGAHSEGNLTKAKGNFSHVEGVGSTADGDFGHSEGNYSSANGRDSHAEGLQTIASGESSHAENSWTTASGLGSHAEGNYTVASAQSSHAGGEHTIASQKAQTVIGKYNVEDTDDVYAFIIGNGDEVNNKENRSNAFAIRWDGTVDVKGKTIDLTNLSSGGSSSGTTYGLSLTGDNLFLVEGGSTSSVSLPTYDDSSIKTRLTALEGKTIDTALSSTSTNAVQNKVINSALENKQDKGDYATKTEVSTEIATQIAKITANAPEDFDTLKEISDWITTHENSAAAMNTAIQNKQNKLTAGTGINISDDNTISSTIVNTDTKYGLSLSDGIVSLVENGATKSITLPTYDDSSVKTRLTALENKTYDDELNATSTNAVQNKTLYSIIGDINTILDKLVSVE